MYTRSASRMACRNAPVMSTMAALRRSFPAIMNIRINDSMDIVGDDV